MIRISIPYLVGLISKLDSLDRITEETTRDFQTWYDLTVAESSINDMHVSSLFAPYLRTTGIAASQLLNDLKIATESFKNSQQAEGWILSTVKVSARQYRIAILAELGSLDAYFVTRKGGFDTLSLLTSGETLFSAELIHKVPGALFDVKEAAKCIAFEMPTACGFHLFRAAESVLRSYFERVADGHEPPKIRTLGMYLKRMEAHSLGDTKIVAALKQISSLHRNPVIHPEVSLTIEEALSTLGVVRSAISAMLAAIPLPLPTTAAPNAWPASPPFPS